jgi:hypothetical protein
MKLIKVAFIVALSLISAFAVPTEDRVESIPQVPYQGVWYSGTCLLMKDI